jgi:hypothetical protein
MHPHDVLGNNEWLGPWIANTIRDRDVVAATFTLFLAAALGVASRRSRQQSTDKPPSNAVVFLLPSLLALAVWFVTAPAVRFTLGPLWVIAIGALALSAAHTARRASRVMQATVLLALTTAFGIGLVESDSSPSSRPVRHITTLSGLSINVPAKGDQCGDAPLPCSSQPPDERLELRQPGTLAKGFRIGYSRTNTPTGSVNDPSK